MPSVFGSGIDGLIYDYEDKEIRIDTIDWHVLTDDISDLSEALEGFREEACEWDIPARKYKNKYLRLIYLSVRCGSLVRQDYHT